jgi:hypothetical protein
MKQNKEKEKEKGGKEKTHKIAVTGCSESRVDGCEGNAVTSSIGQWSKSEAVTVAVTVL